MSRAQLGLSLPCDDVVLAEGAKVLRGFALPFERAVLDGVAAVLAEAPPRHLVTPGGYTMSVAMTNCGALGWVSDARGYRYDARDPLRDAPWPAMPVAFVELARRAAASLGFDDYAPDACLVNRYVPGARLSLHRDADERDRVAPIVSVSLGVPAVFLFGGDARGDATTRVVLEHGDVTVWGGPSRMRYHAVAPLRRAWHPAFGEQRINLTFRKVR